MCPFVPEQKFVVARAWKRQRQGGEAVAVFYQARRHDGEQVALTQVEDYLPQFETFAALCGLDYQEPVYTCGIGYTDRDNEEALNAQKQEARRHAARLVAKIKETAA